MKAKSKFPFNAISLELTDKEARGLIDAIDAAEENIFREPLSGTSDERWEKIYSIIWFHLKA